MRFSALSSLGLRRSGLLALLVLAFSGCGGGSADEAPVPTVVYDPASDNHGYGYGFSVETRLGTKVRFAPTLNPGIPAADIGYYDNEWAALKLCTGLTAKPPPFVVMVQFGQIEELAPPLIRRGKFFAEPPLIVIDDTASWYAHEALHYLLYKALGDLDSAHTSPLWLRCAGHPT